MMADYGMLLFVITSGVASAGGSWVAIKFSLKFHDYRISKIEEQSKEHSHVINQLDKRTTMCQNCKGVRV